MTLTRKRLLVEIFLTRRLSKELAFSEYNKKLTIMEIKETVVVGIVSKACKPILCRRAK